MCADDGICQETLLWSVVALCAAKKKLLRRKKRRALWCKQWLSRRHLKGSFNQIFMELQVENPTDFENYTRMPIPAFYKLLTKIEPYICKQDTSFRDSISPGARLEATLRFLLLFLSLHFWRFSFYTAWTWCSKQMDVPWAIQWNVGCWPLSTQRVWRVVEIGEPSALERSVTGRPVALTGHASLSCNLKIEPTQQHVGDALSCWKMTFSTHPFNTMRIMIHNVYGPYET